MCFLKPDFCFSLVELIFPRAFKTLFFIAWYRKFCSPKRIWKLYRFIQKLPRVICLGISLLLNSEWITNFLKVEHFFFLYKSQSTRLIKVTKRHYTWSWLVDLDSNKIVFTFFSILSSQVGKEGLYFQFLCEFHHCVTTSH